MIILVILKLSEIFEDLRFFFQFIISNNFCYYEETGKSTITIPRPIIDAGNLNWEHKDDINIIIKTIDGQEGLFLFKREKDKD